MTLSFVCNTCENKRYIVPRKMNLVFCLLLFSIGMSVLKILCLTIVDIMYNVYCNISRIMFSLFCDSQGCLCPSLSSILSGSALQYLCSPSGTYVQAEVMLGCIPPSLSLSVLTCNKSINLSKSSTGKDT